VACGRWAGRKKAAATGAAASRCDPWGCGRFRQAQFSVSSPPEDELSECPHDGAGLGAAQLGAAGAGSGAGSTIGAAGFGAAAFFAGLFLATAFLATAFLADFFGAAFLADFFTAFLAFFADFLADFFADFFFAATTLFLPFLLLAFLPAFFFLPLAIVILLLPPINVHQRFKSFVSRDARRSVQFWPGTARRPIEKLNRVHHRD
jgi:hypothetical protein